MSSFKPAFDCMIVHEGGYVSDPDDPGGETRFGISRRSYPNLDIKKLTIDDAQSIYQRDFWEPYPYCLIDEQPVANKAFDMAVNMGHEQAAKLLQRACIQCGHPIVADGKLGPLTIAAVNQCYSPDLLTAIREKQLEFYQTLAAKNPHLVKFLHGWTVRANS